MEDLKEYFHQRMNGLDGEINEVKSSLADLKDGFGKELAAFRKQLQVVNNALVTLLSRLTNAVIGLLGLIIISIAILCFFMLFRDSDKDIYFKSHHLGEIDVLTPNKPQQRILQELPTASPTAILK